MSEKKIETIFDRMNRKQKREFEKLPMDEKIKILSAEITNKVTASMESEMLKSFYRGYLQAHKMLAEEFVIPMNKEDVTEEEVKDNLDKLIAKIIEVHQHAVKEFNKIDEELSKKESKEKE